MAALAIKDDERLYLSPIELERGGISYSVDTLEHLSALFPSAAFDWIVGEDNVAQLLDWKDPQRLFELARFVVLTRSGASRDAIRHLPPDRVVYAENKSVPVSSTDIRNRVRAGESIDAFVDPLVSRYIHHYGLYKEDHS